MGNNMSLSGKDLYFVAVKVFLRDDTGRLLITKDIFNTDWDIPGGRLREMDFDISLENVVARKIQEELGDKVKYKLGEPKVFMCHERAEILPDGTRTPVRIFAIGYDAQYMGGEIKLGKNHEKYEWVDLKSFVPEDRFVGGWLKGIKEYAEICSAK